MGTTTDNRENLENYIILEGRTHGTYSYPDFRTYSYPDLLVSMERTYQNHNWMQANKALTKEDSFMLTIRQYVDFLKLLRSENVYTGTGNRLNDYRMNTLLEDITKKRGGLFRAEWLDAQFSSNGRQLQITYNRIKPNGKLEKITEPLQDCLMTDKIPGISLDYWLINANLQGLPSKNIYDGDLYYWFPRQDDVAGFRAYSDGVGLYCYGGPQGSGSGLGVRPAKVRNK